MSRASRRAGRQGGTLDTTQLDRIERAISDLTSLVIVALMQGETIMASIDDLEAQAQENTDTEQSALRLIEGLAAQILADARDPARMIALAAKLKASAAALAAAIVANTPGAPPPEPEPVPA